MSIVVSDTNNLPVCTERKTCGLSSPCKQDTLFPTHHSIRGRGRASLLPALQGRSKRPYRHELPLQEAGPSAPYQSCYLQGRRQCEASESDGLDRPIRPIPPFLTFPSTLRQSPKGLSKPRQKKTHFVVF